MAAGNCIVASRWAWWSGCDSLAANGKVCGRISVDYDDLVPKKSSPSAIGDNLATLSVGELECRITDFEAEIARIRDELERKRKHEAAAAALFKS
jgi:uncharacterized small protein (DUF1192 family)